nr:MAG TPA: hypothetical protein [Caudoviricetes sp.]DAZ14563.1 MAG TPA: hypothetical protein [Caudoviricetes sp.]DAZ37601.1 MAG TPA: hypothetical protein [Caudoviricetes sp.]
MIFFRSYFIVSVLLSFKSWEASDQVIFLTIAKHPGRSQVYGL